MLEEIQALEANEMLAGQVGSDAQKVRARKQQIALGQHGIAAPIDPIPPVLNDGAGTGGEVDHKARDAHRNPVDLAAIQRIEDVCLAIRSLHRENRYAIDTRMGMQARLGAYVRREIFGWRLEMAEKERAKATKAAATLIKALRESNQGDDIERQYPDLKRMILATDHATATWEEMEAISEKRITKLVKSLPIAPFIAGVRGFGWVSAGRIIGEAGGLHHYPNPAKLWKRMGLSVLDGKRQRRVTGEAALEHGYSPRRRSVTWVAFSSVKRAQRVGDRDGEPAHATGYYGEIYGEAKARYMQRVEDGEDGWTRGRADMAASRYAEKRLLLRFWRAWRDSVGIVKGGADGR